MLENTRFNFSWKGDFNLPIINMLSSADKTAGHGVASAYLEQVNLVKNGLSADYKIKVNKLCLADITHYHTVNFRYFLSIPFAKLMGTTVAYVHFLPETLEDSIKLPFLIKKLFYKYIIWFYKNVDHLVVVNPYFIQALQGYKVDAAKITYIPNFVAEKNFYNYPKEQVKQLKEKYNIKPESFVVLGVGQVQTRKGILDFIEVAKKLPQLDFIWAGGFSFGAITDGYKELKLVMDNHPTNVRFLGIVGREEMNDIYNICDLMFLPSFNELFPMAILEAIALKKPVLLRDLTIYQDILFDFYLKGDNITEFTELIAGLAENPEVYLSWQEKSAKCHQFYSEKYVLKQWQEFYDGVLPAKNKKISSGTYEKQEN